MSDLDIVVKLDPGQPVAGANAVTAALGKTEAQAKKTESAAAGIAKLNFKQAAAGVGQAFELINQKLKITDSELGSMVGSAVKFGQLGAQIAGPWGAVAGALLGVALEGEGTFEMLERVADASKTADERIAELINGSSTLGGQFAAITSGAHSMSEAIVLVTAHLQRLHDATATFSSLGSVLKQVNDQLDAQKRILGEIDNPRTKFVQDMTALNMLFNNGAVSAADYVRQQAALTTSFAEHEGVVVKVAKAYKDLDQMQSLRDAVGNYGRVARNAEWAAEDERNRPGFREVDVGSLKPFEMKDVLGASGDLKDIQKAFDAQAVEDWKKAVEESQKAVEELAQHMKPLEDFFVTAATTGKLEWRSMIDAMIADLARLAAQKLVMGAMGGSGEAGSAAGILGLLGSLVGAFASGGTIYPSGGGSADTQTVAFRKRPDETVHINTPQQEQAYQRGGSGGGSRTQVLNVQTDDSRALMQGFDGPDGDRVVLNVMRRNPRAFRALLNR